MCQNRVSRMIHSCQSIASYIHRNLTSHWWSVKASTCSLSTIVRKGVREGVRKGVRTPLNHGGLCPWFKGVLCPRYA
jgi:hypothetical protein